MVIGRDVDPAALCLDERIAAVGEPEREIARLQARQVVLTAAIVADPCAGSGAPALDKEMVKEELRAALGESANSVANRILLARQLVGRLPVALAALQAGRITVPHARLLVDAVIPLDDSAASAVEAAAMPFAAGRDLAAFARKVRREAVKADPRTAEAQLAAAVEQRRVWTRPDEHGVSVLGAVLPAEAAQALDAALDVLADRPTDPSDPRTREQRRADALVQLGADALTGGASPSTCPSCGTHLPGRSAAGAGPRWHGLRPTAQVTVALSTLLGVDEQPGELDGYGPIAAGLARLLAADPTGTWRRLITDPLGRLVDSGRTRYRPPSDLADYVRARDRTCRFPTCTRRACSCELDHVQPWADGGQTDEANLLVLCRRHHHGKHDAGWHPRSNDDRSVTWTSPAGLIYTVPPATYPTDTTADMYVRNDNHEPADPDPAMFTPTTIPKTAAASEHETSATRPDR